MSAGWQLARPILNQAPDRREADLSRAIDAGIGHRLLGPDDEDRQSRRSGEDRTVRDLENASQAASDLIRSSGRRGTASPTKISAHCLPSRAATESSTRSTTRLGATCASDLKDMNVDSPAKFKDYLANKAGQAAMLSEPSSQDQSRA